MNDLIAKSIDTILAAYDIFAAMQTTDRQRILKAKLFYAGWCDYAKRHQRYCDIAALYAIERGDSKADVRQYATNCLFIDTSKLRSDNKTLLPISFAVNKFEDAMLAVAHYVCHCAMALNND